MVTNNGITGIEGVLSTYFTAIALGTDGTPVTGSETSLTGQVSKAVISTNLLPGGYIQFNAQIAATDPAMTVREMGLVNAAGALCYRQVITPVTTVSGVVYSLGYKIKLS
jgi:hypothetical protein